jgi:pimeloyl-ACP methyl ester carboxylesterase
VMCCSSHPPCSLVVLIHSLGTYSAVWDDLVETLEDSSFLVLRYDLLGMGFSGKAPVRNYSPRTLISQLENLMKDLGITARTYDMIGHGVIDHPPIHL